MNRNNAEALPIFLLEGLVVDLVRGTQMGRVGEQQPPGILATLSRNKSHWHWRQKFMGTRRDAEALLILLLGGLSMDSVRGTRRVCKGTPRPQRNLTF
jgi:hypothetical protein